MRIRDRIKAITWLFFLQIWRVLLECIKAVVLIIFFIPMIFSTKVYEIISEFIYESIESDEHFKTDRSESEGISSHTELPDNRPVDRS
jgi:hypothetical protein